MAEEFPRQDPGQDQFKFDRFRYPWTDWLNGSLWKLEHGVDFGISTRSFVSAVHHAARESNMRVRTKTEGNTVWIQAGVPPEEILI